MKVFSVYDSKAGAYMTPFFADTNGLAVRMFSDICNDRETVYWKHPEDFTLFELGEWSKFNSMFDLLQTPVPLVKASEVHGQAMMSPGEAAQAEQERLRATNEGGKPNGP